MNLIKKTLTRMRYHLLLLSVYLLSLLPSSVLNMLANLVYFLSYKVFKYRYGVVLQNISRSFPQMSYEEVQHTTRGFYRYFSQLLAEMVKLVSVSERRLKQRVHIANAELLQHYHSQNRNIIAVLGHYGNWEYLNILPRFLSFEVNAIYKPLSDTAFNLLTQRFRSRFGLRLLPMQHAARHMLLRRHKPELYLFLADQSPADARCRVNFLHQSTAMFSGAEKLAKATDAVVVYIELTKQADGWAVHFRLVSEHPQQTATHEITRLFAGSLEQTIQQAPQYWLWSHRRWKGALHLN